MVGVGVFLRQGADQVAGLYLTNGGRSYLLIEGQSMNRLKVSGGEIITRVQHRWRPEKLSASAEYRGGALHLRQVQSTHESDESGGGSIDIDLSLNLSPSVTSPGDWDASSIGYVESARGWSRFRLPSESLTSPAFYRELWENIFYPYTLYTDTSGNLPSETQSIPSVLHRVADAGLIEYFRAREKSIPTAEEVSRFLEQIRRHPDDPYLTLHAVDLMRIAGSVPEADSAMKEWRNRFGDHKDLALLDAAKLVEDGIWRAKETERVDHWPEVMHALLRDHESLDDLINACLDLLEYDRIPTAQIDLFLKEGDTGPFSVSFEAGKYTMGLSQLEVHYTINALRVLGYFHLLRGNWEKAFDHYTAVNFLGQIFLQADEDGISELFGHGFLQQAARGFSHIPWNACNTVEDLRRVRSRLAELETFGPIGGVTDVALSEYSRLVASLDLKRTEFGTEEDWHHRYNWKTKVSRFSMAFTDASLQLKEFTILHGRFPESIEELEESLGSTFPRDPFGDGPLGFLRKDENNVVVYSIGPDGVSDHGLVEYEGWKDRDGGISRGDILESLSLPPTYPYPPEGLRANSLEDVFAQFPNGLPPDPFASHYRLILVDSGPGKPVSVLSLGPKQDLATDTPSLRAYSVPRFEPLDLITKIDMDAQYVLKEHLEEDVEYYDDLQRVKQELLRLSNLPYDIVTQPTEDNLIAERNRLEARAKEEQVFKLGPPYNPSNGVESYGHFWMELPGR